MQLLLAANQFFDIIELDLSWRIIIGHLRNSFRSSNFNIDIWVSLNFCFDSLSICDNEAAKLHLPIFLIALCSELHWSFGSKAPIGDDICVSEMLKYYKAAFDLLMRVIRQIDSIETILDNESLVAGIGLAESLLNSYLDETPLNTGHDGNYLIKVAFNEMLELFPKMFRFFTSSNDEAIIAMTCAFACLVLLNDKVYVINDPQICESLLSWIEFLLAEVEAINAFPLIAVISEHILQISSSSPRLDLSRLENLFSKVHNMNSTD